MATAGGRRLVQPLSQPRRTPRALEPQHSPQHWLWVRTASPHSQVRMPCTLLPLLPKRWHGRGRSDAVQCRGEGRTKAAGAARAGTEGCCCRARECLRRAGASNERGGRGGWFHSAHDRRAYVQRPVKGCRLLRAGPGRAHAPIAARRKCRSPGARRCQIGGSHAQGLPRASSPTESPRCAP